MPPSDFGEIYNVNNHIDNYALPGAAQRLWRWGVQFRERSERKNFFWPPTFGLPGGHETGYCSLLYCNYDVWFRL